MAEWFKAAVLKTAVRETVPGVRIPLSPPISLRSIRGASRLQALRGSRRSGHESPSVGAFRFAPLAERVGFRPSAARAAPGTNPRRSVHFASLPWRSESASGPPRLAPLRARVPVGRCISLRSIGGASWLQALRLAPLRARIPVGRCISLRSLGGASWLQALRGSLCSRHESPSVGAFRFAPLAERVGFRPFAARAAPRTNPRRSVNRASLHCRSELPD